mmetsp:Transcript_5405/g.11766  ORF Transcript_5405/g.11766 Transcript_5405/m.11766 type:complete len:128 (+) Transcript_5405:1205-1588(+)
MYCLSPYNLLPVHGVCCAAPCAADVYTKASRKFSNSCLQTHGDQESSCWRNRLAAAAPPTNLVCLSVGLSLTLPLLGTLCFFISLFDLFLLSPYTPIHPSDPPSVGECIVYVCPSLLEAVPVIRLES